MLQIKDTLVSLDLAERYFCCDLDTCHGACCIDGDAGAPITDEEYKILEQVVPIVSDDLTPAGKREIDEHGVGYHDPEGELVTTIVDGRDCAFCTYAPGGLCLCAIEKAYNEGRTTFRKPQSCYLYPVRLTRYPTFTAVNYHRWKICKPAEVLGRKLGMRLYQFLKRPLIDTFGQEWYDELALTCEEYLRQYPSD